MRVLENCEPKRVFYYFEEICKIPHGSGNTKQISDYLVSFCEGPWTLNMYRMRPIMLSSTNLQLQDMRMHLL